MKVIWIAAEGQNHKQLCPVGSPCEEYHSASEAAFDIQRNPEGRSVCVVESPLEDESTLEIIDTLRRARTNMPVVILNVRGTVPEAVSVIRAGAYHYFSQIPGKDEFARILDRIAEERLWNTEDQPGSGINMPPSGAHSRNMLIGSSPAMQEVARITNLIAPRTSTVLILGETGTGKELIANAIHGLSPRGSRPMVTVNCPAIPSDLLESEMFGHVRGAFTGASNNRIGKFEQAHESTLFIDEIGDLPLDLQAKLLRAIQEREVQPVGSSETIRIDVRVIAATNIDLLERVKQGRFREDLYYRLNVVPIQLPNLRDRSSDIPLLARYFVNKVAERESLPVKEITPDAMGALAGYSWPGNVRQLQNIVEMACVLSGERVVLNASDFKLPNAAAAKRRLRPDEELFIPIPEFGIDFEEVMAGVEMHLLNQALERSKGNKSVAARLLRIKRTTFVAKIRSRETLDGAVVS